MAKLLSESSIAGTLIWNDEKRILEFINKRFEHLGGNYPKENIIMITKSLMNALAKEENQVEEKKSSEK